MGLSPWRDVMCDTLCMLDEAAVRGLIDCKYAPKWTSAGQKDVISLPRNRSMCNRLQVITSFPVCAKRAITYVRHWNTLLWGWLRGVTLYVRYALYAEAKPQYGVLYFFIYRLYIKYAPIMSATRPKRTKIDGFSAHGWNLPKMHMPTCYKSAES